MSRLRLAVPPGRAGRLWLDRRLGAARRGADLLDRKLRILQAELGGLREDAARTEREWRERSAEAERALLIAALLGGQRAARLATGSGHADVRIGYAVTIGVRHPARGSSRRRPGRIRGPGSRSSRHGWRTARRSPRRSGHAVAAEAVRVIEAETTATRYRLRAIRDRLIPSLEQARAEVALAIDELERADGARLRRAAGTSERRGAGGRDLRP